MLQDLSDLQDNMSEVYRTTVIKVDGKQTSKLSLANTNVDIRDDLPLMCEEHHQPSQ